MRSVIALAVLAYASCGCDSLGLSDSAEVRVQNAAAATFDEVSFWAGNQEVSYSALEPGQHTPYVEAEDAYAVTTVQVVVDADTTRLQVIDHVGDTPLEGGQYTYILGLEGPPNQRSLTQVLRRDS